MVKSKSRESGQSTIEFILTFTASVGFIFLFLKLAMNYTSGYMVHHATYMAARTYLVVDEERDTVDDADNAAIIKARAVFTRYLPPGLVSGVDVEELKANSIEGQMTYAAFIGLWIKYTQAFSLGFVGGKAPVLFRSEAFLGREPTRTESVSQVCIALKSAFPGKNCGVHVTLDDNGG